MTRRIRFTPLLAAGCFLAGVPAPQVRAADVPFAFVATTGTVAPFFRGNQAEADLDADGDVDVVVIDLSSDEVRWLENVDGAGTWQFHFISTASNGPQGVTAADLDEDGDVDLAVTSLFDGKLVWLENAAGTGLSWNLHTVSTDAPNGYVVAPADLDRDGDPDLAYATGLNSDQVATAWFENLGGGAGWTKHPLHSGGTKPAAIQPADMDGDGDLDLLSTSFWQENSANGASWTTHTIPGAAVFNASLSMGADVDGDGDLDVVGIGTNGRLAWFENLDGAAATWSLHPFAETQAPLYATVADIDVDGDADVLVTLGHNYGRDLAWFENTTDGLSWIKHVVSTAPPASSMVRLTDVDGDGDPDITAVGFGTPFAWWRNQSLHETACFVPRTVSMSVAGAQAVVAADVDGDGDLDAVSTAFLAGAVLWHDNTAGDASAWVTRTIATGFPSAAVAAAGDIDRDGDVDVAAIGAPVGAGTLAWFSNTAGDGSAWTRSTVSTAFNRVTHVELTDLSGDGDLDLLGAGYYSSTLLFENAAGNGSAWTTVTLPSGAQTGVATGDLDRDGDLDVTSTESFFGDGLGWTENISGTGATWAAHTIATPLGQTYAMAAVDLDGDGDLDVLQPGANFLVGSTFWYENVGGSASSWALHGIPGAEATIAAAADLDRDGDVDVVAPGSPGALFFWENIAGTGLAWTRHTIADVGGAPRQLAVADLDRDGDADVLASTAATGAVDWYENRGGQARVEVGNQAPATANNGELVSMLRATVTHLGRAGEGPIELASLGLLFEETAGDPLTSAEANALVESLRVYRDANGSGVFEPATDVQVTSMPTLTLTNGVATVAFTDGDANVQVAVGTPRTYFVVVELSLTASGQVPNQFRVTLLQTGASRSVVEDRTFDLPLRLACPADLSSIVRQVVPVELTGFAVE